MVKEEQTPSGSSHSELNHYTKVFIDGEGNAQKRILVQGQTGIGKTTFVRKVAVDWAELNDENTEHDMKLAKNQIMKWSLCTIGISTKYTYLMFDSNNIHFAYHQISCKPGS